jgi:defect in organelle trafficking protein DotC
MDTVMIKMLRHNKTPAFTALGKISIASCIAFSLTACTPPSSGGSQVDGVDSNGLPLVSDTAVQLGYTNLPTGIANDPQISQIRLTAIEGAASSLGARGALAWRSEQINTTLTRQESFLDSIFNFNALMLPHNVVPPVLVEGNNQYSQDDPNTVRMSSKTYKILKPAHFATTPPTWRTYLSMPYKKPNLPDRAVLPVTADEITIWNKLYVAGWNSGLSQANMIFNSNLNRLKRDYNGIILYRKLYTQKMISSPYVSEAKLGITGDKDAIKINDRVLRITNASMIQTNSSKWQPIITNR